MTDPEPIRKATMPDTATPSPIVDAAELARLRSDDPALVVLDVQWTLGRTDGHDRYLEAHVPGARFVDLDTELAAPPSEAGRHPLPDAAVLQAALRRAGVTADSTIVVTDQRHGFAAARLWWLLRHAGIDARVLDGGLAAWFAAGEPTESGEPDAVPGGDIAIAFGAAPTLSIDEAAALPATGVLLDARAGERYRGETEPIDPRAGHIPGALSAPTADNLDADGRFFDPAALRVRFAEVGAVDGAEVGVYCGSGITAAHEVLALELAGVRASLFPGSWSQWSQDAARPVAVGAEA